MDIMEMRVEDECKEEFDEMKNEMKEMKGEMK
jgi:hypothetical protein